MPPYLGATIKRARLFIMILGAATAIAVEPPDAQAPHGFPLATAMNEISAMQELGVEVGAFVQSLDGDTYLAYQMDEPFVLASNTKLFTTSAAILNLPPEFHWKTTARFTDDVLWIIGGGDATFNIIDGYSYPDRFLDELAAVLRERGTTRVDELIVDGRYFDSMHQHPYWPRDQLRKRYAAPVSGLPYGRGLVRMKIGKSSVYAATYDPIGSAKLFLARGLEKRGINIKTAREAGPLEPAPPSSRTIYVQPSAWSLREIIAKTNTDSDNFLAEHLLKTLGVELSYGGTFNAGVGVVRDTLFGAGIPSAGFSQLDGSGLARVDFDGGNRASPTTIVALLRTMASHPHGDMLIDSLAIGGRTGTLKSRFRKGTLRGAVLAKTGWIKGAYCLSGYLVRGEGHVAAFSILANYDANDTYDLRQTIAEFQEAVLHVVWDHMGDAPPNWPSAPPVLAQRFPSERP